MANGNGARRIPNSNDDDDDSDSRPLANHPSTLTGSETAVSLMGPNENNDADVDQPLSTPGGETAATAQNANDASSIFVEEEIISPAPDGGTDASESDGGDGDSPDNSWTTSNNDPPRKQRVATDGTEVGAVQVAEQAPQVNRRFFLGLTRASVRARNQERRAQNRRARRTRQDAEVDENNLEAQTHEGQGSGTQGRGSNVRRSVDGANRRGSVNRRMSVSRISDLLSRVSARNLVEATLVEENENEEMGVVYEAEPVSLFVKKWKIIATGMCFLLVLAAIIISVLLEERADLTDAIEVYPPSEYPSIEPSSAPSFVPGPTLQIVQERGHIRCGLRNATISEGGFELKMCQAVAAVIFGNADNIESVPVEATNRFQQLHGRSVDLLLGSVTHTIEREVRERTTGVGFSFSSPYYYDGMTYYGNETFIECAEEPMRFAECSTLQICVKNSTTHYDYIKTSFPSDFFTVSPSDDIVMMKMLSNGTCNVLANDRSTILRETLTDRHKDGKFKVGNDTARTEPLAIVTRNNDAEFSDVVNWVVQAIIYGEEKGLSKDKAACQEYINLTGSVLDLDFMKAVYCVGSYGQIVFGSQQNKHGMNTVNNGTTGMLYATPFSSYGQIFDGLPSYRGVNAINNGTTGMLFATPYGDIGGDFNENMKDTAGGVLLDEIRNSAVLNCGVIVPNNFTEEARKNLNSFNVAYCKVVAAGLFNGNYRNVTTGNPQGVNLTSYTEEDGYAALDNKIIDVLAGARIERKYDFESQSLGGFHFSTPYYYGDEPAGDDVSFFSLATRDGETIFSSFVNCMVVATIHAYDVRKWRSQNMPSMSLFGSELTWSLRDAISWMGGYNQIYSNSFGILAGKDRGRNTLNGDGAPQLNSFSGVNHTHD